LNYLIDEDRNPGKGANATINHFLETPGVKEKHLKLHADNCVGQNKNNILMQYLWHNYIDWQERKYGDLIYDKRPHQTCS